MRTMKDSGIAWIGEMPEEWEATMLKNHVVCLDGQRIPVDAAQRSPGVYPYWGAGNIVDYVDNFLFDEELVLLGEDGAPFFDPYRPVAFYSNEKIWVNNHIHVLRAKSINAKYLVYSLNSIDYSLYINGSILSKLTQSNMNKIFLCYPPLPEQRRIADYLDAKCAEIDNSMKLVRQGIDKLKEYKKSVITEAVTKGLDPDVPMKDSGVPWIGEIPEEWEVRKIKSLASSANTLFMDGDWIESDIIENEGIRYLTTGNIGTLFYKEQGAGYISEESFQKLNCLQVYSGDLAISRLNEPLGRACLIPDKEKRYVVAVDIVILRPNENINKNFLLYPMNIDSYNFYVKLHSRGTTMPRVSRTILGNMVIPLPPFAEQCKIASYLDAKCAEIDTLITEKQALLDKLAEYKKSLIFECVTGKREVAA